MGRPILQLSDQEHTDLALQLPHIIARHATSPKRHREFVRDFLNAVYVATGQVYGGAFYRRLLHEHVPQRHPSTAIIQAEIVLFRRDLCERAKGRSLAEPKELSRESCDSHDSESTTKSVSLVDRRLLEQVLRQVCSVHSLLQSKEVLSPAPRTCEVQPLTQFYQERLIAVEAELSKVRMENQEVLFKAMSMAAAAADQYYQYHNEQMKEMIRLQEIFRMYAAATELRIQELERLAHVASSGESKRS